MEMISNTHLALKSAFRKDLSFTTCILFFLRECIRILIISLNGQFKVVTNASSQNLRKNSEKRMDVGHLKVDFFCLQ